ncbi:MAG: PAS domain S-box protein [Desulfatitalea sp.]|nr:PAS domain S-box protein [Desulfatitalea sp.]NNK02449.1 PAS domain S-box protein [Desulfatitalea sp.]
MPDRPTIQELQARIRQLDAENAIFRRDARQKAINELKWQWQTTFDSLGASICVMDSDWQVLQCNRVTAELLGKSMDEIIGRKCFELVHNTAEPPPNCPARQLIHTGRRAIEVLKVRDRWWEVAVDPILDDNGTLKGIVHVITDITQHKLLTASVEARERALRSIFKAAPVGIGVVVDRVLTQANDCLCAMTGYSRDALVGQSVRMLYPADADLEFVGREKYHQIVEQGTGTVETCWQRKNGGIIDVLLSSTPINVNDWSEGVTFTAMDITARKENEAALMAAAQVFKGIPSGLFVYDFVPPDRLILFQSNPAAAELTGLVVQDWIGKEFDEIWPRARQEGIKQAFVDVMKSGQPYHTESIYYHDERLQGVFKIHAFPMYDDRLCVAFENVTERKQIEAQLKSSVQRFRALAELLPQTVFEIDMDFRLSFINKNALRIFGYSQADLDKGLIALDMLIAEDRERARKNLKLIARGENRQEEGFRCTALRKDGSTFPVLIYSSLRREEGVQAGLRGIIIDISEQERLVAERDSLQAQYIHAQKIEAVGRLAGGVAHDLNNMLSPIVGYGELMLDTMAPGDAFRKEVEQILSAGRRAKDMVRQLLAFSRKQALEIKSVNLNRVLAGFEGLLDRILRDDIKLELRIARGIPNILADAGQIEQVVMNLAVNAQDAMPEGGKITIELDHTRLSEAAAAAAYQGLTAGQYVVLSFHDTGHGMDEKTQARIFDPFFTTKGKGQGTGLGMATVYGIVKQHDGSISVSSAKGKGTRFTIFFPSAPEAAIDASLAQEDAKAVTGSECVLIVEDNDAVRHMAETILKKYGYRTFSVSGGDACLELMPAGYPFDMLLTDVVLQDTNGKALFNEVKVYYPGIKVLYMSGYTDDVIVNHGVLEEGIAFIQKPFSVQELLRKVRAVLDGI